MHGHLQDINFGSSVGENRDKNTWLNKIAGKRNINRSRPPGRRPEPSADRTCACDACSELPDKADATKAASFLFSDSLSANFCRTSFKHFRITLSSYVYLWDVFHQTEPAYLLILDKIERYEFYLCFVVLLLFINSQWASGRFPRKISFETSAFPITFVLFQVNKSFSRNANNTPVKTAFKCTSFGFAFEQIMNERCLQKKRKYTFTNI